MNNLQSAKLDELLTSSGYSRTRQRQLIFEVLLDQEPLSMHELIVRVKGRMDRASIYRTVALFEKLGIIQRLNFGWKYKVELTDKFAEHHHHLSCIRCGRMVSINEEELEDFVNNSARLNGFIPTSHQIEIQGLCQRCREGN